jgi:hypothetical protein
MIIPLFQILYRLLRKYYSSVFLLAFHFTDGRFTVTLTMFTHEFVYIKSSHSILDNRTTSAGYFFGAENFPAFIRKQIKKNKRSQVADLFHSAYYFSATSNSLLSGTRSTNSLRIL